MTACSPPRQLCRRSDATSLCLRFGDSLRESTEQDFSSVEQARPAVPPTTTHDGHHGAAAAAASQDYDGGWKHPHVGVEYTVIVVDGESTCATGGVERSAESAAKWHVGGLRSEAGSGVCRVAGLSPATRYRVCLQTCIRCIVARNEGGGSNATKPHWEIIRRRSVSSPPLPPPSCPPELIGGTCTIQAVVLFAQGLFNGVMVLCVRLDWYSCCCCAHLTRRCAGRAVDLVTDRRSWSLKLHHRHCILRREVGELRCTGSLLIGHTQYRQQLRRRPAPVQK